MKEEILRLCIDYTTKGGDESEILHKICTIMIPPGESREVPNKFIREILGFIYDIDPEEIIGNKRDYEFALAKIMYREFMYEKYENYSTAASKCNISRVQMSKSLKNHRNLMDTNLRYFKIYVAIVELLELAI